MRSGSRGQALAVEIRAEFAVANGRYDSPRIARALTTDERKLGRRRTARIIRQEGLVARPRRGRKPRTTDSNHQRRIAPNLLVRDFTVDGPNKVWMGDITYIAPFAGRMYLAVILDLFSRKVIGWALAGPMHDGLVLEALDNAMRIRGPDRGALHYSDRDSQYASEDYIRALDRRGFVASMSRKGDCWDNAVVESFFAPLKTELGDTFDSTEDARARIGEFIDDFYNYRRLHSSIGYVSPARFEMRHQLAAGTASPTVHNCEAIPDRCRGGSALGDRVVRSHEDSFGLDSAGDQYGRWSFDLPHPSTVDCSTGAF